MQKLPKYEDLAEPENAKELLAATAVLKLNGGLGTSMGLEKAKSLLTVKEGKTFLDLIAEQVRSALTLHCRACLVAGHSTPAARALADGAAE